MTPKYKMHRSSRGGCAGGSMGLLSESLQSGRSHKYTNRELWTEIPAPGSRTGGRRADRRKGQCLSVQSLSYVDSVHCSQEEEQILSRDVEGT